MDFIITAVTIGVIFGLLDAVWLKSALPFYKKEMGKLLMDKPDLVAGVIFYVIYVVGVTVFAVLPALHSGSWQTAVSLGALFGFVAYATYDLTNLSTLKGWSKKLVVVDMIWGTVATAFASTLAYIVVTGWFGL